MPKDIHTDCKHIEYWVAEKEVKDRKADVAYIKKSFPQTIFRKIKDVGHGGLHRLIRNCLCGGLREAKIILEIWNPHIIIEP